MDESLTYRIGAIVMIFFVSIGGFFLPRIASHYIKGEDIQKNSYFILIKSFGGGIILGVALCHLLGDACKDAAVLYPDYPCKLMCKLRNLFSSINYLTNKYIHVLNTVALAIAAGGILLGLGLDQAAMTAIISMRKDAKPDPNISFADLESVDEITVYINYKAKILSLILNADDSTQKAIIKAFVLEFSVAIHSVIIGFSFGGLTADQFGTIKVLMAALVFHQFFEGLALGAALLESKLGLVSTTTFALIFALSFSLGGIVGVFHSPESSDVLLQICFNSVAAGLLLYSSLVEMIGADFQSPDLVNRPGMKAAMFTALTAGVAAFAVLAIYA